MWDTYKKHLYRGCKDGVTSEVDSGNPSDDGDGDEDYNTVDVTSGCLETNTSKSNV